MVPLGIQLPRHLLEPGFRGDPVHRPEGGRARQTEGQEDRPHLPQQPLRQRGESDPRRPRPAARLPADAAGGESPGPGAEGHLAPGATARPELDLHVGLGRDEPGSNQGGSGDRLPDGSLHRELVVDQRWRRHPGWGRRQRVHRRGVPPCGRELQGASGDRQVRLRQGQGRRQARGRRRGPLQPRPDQRHVRGGSDPDGHDQVRQHAPHRRAGPVGTRAPEPDRQAPGGAGDEGFHARAQDHLRRSRRRWSRPLPAVGRQDVDDRIRVDSHDARPRPPEAGSSRRRRGQAPGIQHARLLQGVRTSSEVGFSSPAGDSMTKLQSHSRWRNRLVAATDWLPRLVAGVPASVHAKLLVAFLATAVLIIALGAVGLQVLSGVNRRAEELVKRQERIGAYRQFQHDTALPSSWSWNERTLEATLQQLNQFHYELDQLQVVALGDTDPLDHIRESYEQLISVIGQVVSLIKGGDLAEARKLHGAQAGPLADRLESLTNDLVNKAEADLVASIDATQTAYTRSRWAVIWFSVSSIGLALALGYAISWSLIRPVKLLDSRLKLVASGELFHRVEVPNRDELGALAVQFNRMATQLQESHARREENTRQWTEALEQQTATAEILRVISRSPTDIQPVLDAVAESAARLCESFDSVVWLRDGDELHLAAHHGPMPIRSTLPLIRGMINGRAVLDGRTIHVADMQAETGEYPEGSENARRLSHRTVLAVPLTREGVAIGTISLRRTEGGLFPDRQVALRQTFADQAIIAIENVRLFKELVAKNRDLAEALEQRTATSEILRVIASSPTEVQPTFEAIVAAADALCGADLSGLFQFDGELIYFAAHHGRSAEEVEAARQAFPQRPGRGSATARAILEAATVQIPDAAADPELPDALRVFRTVLSVPMIRDGRPIGAITVARRAVQRFTDTEAALLQTFADQAVIAVENVRLFQELQARTHELGHSVEELKALGEVGQAVSSSLDLETVLNTIVARAVQLTGAHGGVIYEYDETKQEFDQIRGSH